MQTRPGRWVLLGPAHGHSLLGKAPQTALRPPGGGGQPGGLTRPTNPSVKGARTLADSPLRLLQGCPPGRPEPQGEGSEPAGSGKPGSP